MTRERDRNHPAEPGDGNQRPEIEQSRPVLACPGSDATVREAGFPSGSRSLSRCRIVVYSANGPACPPRQHPFHPAGKRQEIINQLEVGPCST